MEIKYDNTFHITKNNIFSMIHSKQISYDGVSYYFQEENFFKKLINYVKKLIFKR